MDRVFLDANVLFSAAYRTDSGLHRLWRLPGTALLTSAYALEEARINLTSADQRKALDTLAGSLLVAAEPPARTALPAGVGLPEKDRPILLAAIASRATHLLTGDATHFGPYYRRRVAGVLILTPSRYLRQRR